MPEYVYPFAAGSRDMAELLGGKGANLCEMTRLGLPVPPGFVIATTACTEYLAEHADPAELDTEIDAALEQVQEATGRRLGDPADPLLLSVRSGARFSMPGMMDTILDVGLNDRTVEGLARAAGDERFALDSYRRLIAMYGRTVLDVPGEGFEAVLDEALSRNDCGSEHDLSLGALRRLVTDYRQVVAEHTGRPFPQDPAEQLHAAIRAVWRSWNGARARLYRRREHISDDLGTAVTVMAMVFGNLGSNSGTGVAFTRDPATGLRGAYGDYLTDAQGEDVVAGTRTPVGLDELERLDPRSHTELMRALDTLELHYRDLCDVEFTVERGRLWILQTRVGKRTAPAAFRIAVDLLDEGVIDADEALARVDGDQLSQLMFPRFDLSTGPVQLARGVPAAPGAAVGRVVFDSETAVKRAESGESVILVRTETSPDDLPGMVAAAGILTSRGGKTSHAAVVARGMGKTCVCGVDGLDVDVDRRRFITADGTVIVEAEAISVDGATGAVYVGEVPVVPSSLVEFFERGGRQDAVEVPDPVVTAVERLLRHADHRRRLDVRANADLAVDADRARRYGAEGIGLCRTEHMFLGDRRVLIEQAILAEDETARAEPLRRLGELQRADLTELLAAMDGLPVTIRLLDPPLHEFLPDLTDLSVWVATADERAGGSGNGRLDADRRLLTAVRRLHERNPMLGLRGVRLGIVLPSLYAMQTRAIAEATADRLRAGGDPRPQIMVPLVATASELERVRAGIQQVIADVGVETGVGVRPPIGTMIELPRAALVADQIAAAAEFFSFGTNDLTQTTWGMSRDDAEGSFFAEYAAQRIFDVSPFEQLDAAGVGRLVRLATAEGRFSRPELEVGVCGEHGGDPESVRFFHAAGLDYVSCSPFRIPIARLEAGRAALRPEEVDLAPDSR